MEDYFTIKYAMRSGLRFFSILLVVILFGFTVFWLAQPSDILSTPTELDFGLVEGTVNAELPGGYIYFYAEPVFAANTEAEEVLPGIYAYNFSNDSVIRTPLLPTDALEQGEHIDAGVFIAQDETRVGTADETYPAWVDYESDTYYRFETPSLWNESDIVALPESSPNASYVIYHAQAIDISADNIDENSNLENWRTVIHNTATKDSVVLEGAANPQWINNGADVVYVMRDGLFRYNIASGQSAPLDNTWRGLTSSADIDVAEDSSALVMTVPTLNAIAVYTFSDSLNGELTAAGIIADNNTRYFDPVMSPTGRSYVVLAQPLNDEQAVRAEVRSLLSRDVIQSFVPDINSEQLVLLDWRNALTPFELQ